HAEHELLLAHLQAEEPDRAFLAHGGMLGDVQREAGLANAGAGGENDEVAALEARGEGVEVLEPGADAADLPAVRMQVIQPVIGSMEEIPQAAESRFDALLADAEQL